ncbi:MAG: hypothetical protein NT119_11205 [Actinobacteria bacterium]|nr:hypothetical protein [Actinomycetota bacterium]
MRILSKDLALKSTLSVVFLALLLMICGLRSADIAAIILLAAAQIAVGAFVWLVYRSKHQVFFAEAVGMGAAIGFALAFASSQLFRTLLPRSISWAILPLIALALSMRALRNSTISFDKKSRDFNEIFVVISGTLIALSTSWFWLIPTAVAISTLTAWAILHSLRRIFTKTQNLLVNVFGLVGVALATNALLGLSSLEKIRNPLWWSWRFAKIQDPDVLFGESMMHSVGMFGNSDNIFFAGERMHYHWFSFAWNDTLNALFQTDPFAITALAAPVIVLFTLMCLVTTFARRFSNSQVSAPLLVLAVSSMCAGPIPFVRLLHPYSYSFNFSLIYTFAIVILLLSSERSKISTNAILMFVFSAILIGSKVSSAPALVFGLLFATLFLVLRKNEYTKSNFLLSAVSAVAVLTVWYLVYYSANSKTSSSMHIGFGVIFQQKAFVVAGIPTIAFIVGVISILCLLAYSLVGAFWVRTISSASTEFALVFSLAGGLASLFLGVLFYDDGENLAYLIQTAIALILPISIVAICNRENVFGFKKFNGVAFVAVFGVLIAKLYWFLFCRVTGNSAPVVYKSALSLIVPLLAGLIVFVISRIWFRYDTNRPFFLVAAMTISAGTLGSYASFASGFYQDGVSYNLLHVDDADTIVGSASYRELLIWLRNNSRTDDLVATNRYCSDSYQSPPQCLALWNLTSAISRRQVLVEGLYPSQSESLQVEREKRRQLIAQFVDTPSQNTFDALLVYGVRWVVADYAVTQSRSWGNFATVRFTNTAGSILELAPFEN